jgi:hypothetical protein
MRLFIQRAHTNWGLTFTLQYDECHDIKSSPFYHSFILIDFTLLSDRLY